MHFKRQANCLRLAAVDCDKPPNSEGGYDLLVRVAVIGGMMESGFWPALAERFELSGGAITNVVRYAAIRAVRRKTPLITQDDLLDGIAKERLKEGKTT